MQRRERVVRVNEAALGALKVVQGEGVGNTSELEGGGGRVEGGGVEGDYAVPAALHGGWSIRDYGIA